MKKWYNIKKIMIDGQLIYTVIIYNKITINYTNGIRY